MCPACVLGRIRLFLDLLFGLEPVSSSLDEQQPEVEKLFVVKSIICVIIRHMSTHIFFFLSCAMLQNHASYVGESRDENLSITLDSTDL